jgi:hypothetical protein
MGFPFPVADGTVIVDRDVDGHEPPATRLPGVR